MAVRRSAMDAARPGPERGLRAGIRTLIALFLPSVLAGGCMAFLPSDWLSALVLDPEATCGELATRLELGSFPDVATPAEIGLQFEPFTVPSANGRPLGAWFVPAQIDGQLDAEPTGTVLILHGTDGTRACALPWVLVAASNHMHAVVFDYQGYGDSGGTADIATLLDDSEAVLRWILDDDAPARQKVHLLGTSLGTGPALGLATLRGDPRIRSVTLDGTFDTETMATTAEIVLSRVFPLFGVSARLDFAWLFETHARLGEMTVPVLFIHAEDDRETPRSGARRVFDRVGSPAKSLWLFEGMTHMQPLFRAEAEYVSLLVTFWRDPAARPRPAASAGDSFIRAPALSP